MPNNIYPFNEKRALFTRVKVQTDGQTNRVHRSFSTMLGNVKNEHIPLKIPIFNYYIFPDDSLIIMIIITLMIVFTDTCIFMGKEKL